MRTVGLALLLAVVLAVAPAASGDGGPSPGALTGGTGVVAPGGISRYVALNAGSYTVLAHVAVADGRVLRYRTLPGAYGIPVVTGDGTTGGMAADGETLVLAAFSSPPGPGANSMFAVVATGRLRVTQTVLVQGSFSFDALSPDGSTLYLIQYLSTRDFTRYRVRAYDLSTRKLVPGAIVDRREPDEQMHGFPVTRASTRDGGWAYTLYGRDADHAFVHALDTRHSVARCIDLPWRVGRDLGVRMTLRGTRLVLTKRSGGRRLGTVDTRTFTVERA